jgi:hypothetical protein
MQRRLTDNEQKQIQEVCGGLEDLDVYVSGRLELTEKLLAMLHHNTTDGRPYVEPPLTDEDALKRPWVMVKDDKAHGWHGPRMLAACCPENYFTFTPSKSTIVGFRYCRRATPDEIAAAGLGTPDA